MKNSLLSNILNPSHLTGAILLGVLCFLAAIISAKLLKRWTHRIAARSHLGIDRTALNFIGQLMQVGCFLVAAIVYAHLVPALDRLGSTLLASAGVASLVIGLAAQNTLGQLVAGIALLLYRPYGIGDVLTLNAPTGKET